MAINLVIRPFQESDYPAIAEVYNAAWPDHPHTEHSLREEDDHAPYIKWGRLVALVNEQMAGVGEYNQFEGMYHPNKFAASVVVKPAFRSQGIGKALHHQLMEQLQPHDPISLMTWTREDQTHALGWLQKLGFEEKMRHWESRLDVGAFDFGPYAGKIEAVEAAGFELKSLKELQGDPEHKQKVYDLWLEARQDVPSSEAKTQVGFEDYCKWVFESSYFLPEGFLLAVDKATGQYVCLSTLWKTDGQHLRTGLTGTRRAYRRKGLALALKLKAIQFAKANAAKEIRTGNESNNRAMLSINEGLGFVKQPMWFDFVKTFRAETPSTKEPA